MYIYLVPGGKLGLQEDKTCGGKPGELQDDEIDEEDRKNSSHNPVKDRAPSFKSNGPAVRYQYCTTMYSLCIQGERWMPYVL
jgi:hypothetical protein